MPEYEIQSCMVFTANILWNFIVYTADKLYFVWEFSSMSFIQI